MMVTGDFNVEEFKAAQVQVMRANREVASWEETKTVWDPKP